MNRALLLANAIALVVLAGFQFHDQDTAAESVAQRMPHYLQVQKAPQWAVLSEKSDAAATRMVSEPELGSSPVTERFVF